MLKSVENGGHFENCHGGNTKVNDNATIDSGMSQNIGIDPYFVSVSQLEAEI